MKIFSYCASRHKGSYTQQTIEFLLEEINKRTDIELYKYKVNNLNLNACVGCTLCFYGGVCRNDQYDGFNKIKQQLFSSDVIILASPVYACSVSGDMKIFIDRISSHLHLMSLRGKIGIPVLTASNNSLIETNEYLRKIFNYLGAFVPFTIMCTVDYPKQFYSKEFREVKIPSYAEEIVSYSNYEKKRLSNRAQELYFTHMKKQYSTVVGENYEAEYWKREEMLKFDTYQELIDNIMEGKNND